MSTKRLTISDFKDHCVEELETVEKSGAVIEITRDGRIIAVVEPPPAPEGTGGLGDWIGSGAGSVVFAAGYDPDETAFAPEEWEEFPGDDLPSAR